MAAAAANGFEGLIDAVMAKVASATTSMTDVHAGVNYDNQNAAEKVGKERGILFALKTAVIYGAPIDSSVIDAAEKTVNKLNDEAGIIAANGQERLNSAKAHLLAVRREQLLLLQTQQLCDQQLAAQQQDFKQQLVAKQQELTEQKQHFERQLAEQKQHFERQLAELVAATKAEADEKAAAAKIAAAEDAAAKIAAVSAEIAKLIKRN
jgi:hypothetical protein